MATAEEIATIKNRYQWLWKIDTVDPGEDGTFDHLPMEIGDRLFIFFVSDDEVCFHKRSSTGSVNDPGWESARGVFFDKTGKILGEIDDPKKGMTTFTISLDLESSRIRGEHRYNPGGGGWGGGDDP